MRVPDMGGEELEDAAGGAGIGRKERRPPARAGPLHRQRGGGVEGSRQGFGWLNGHLM